MSEAPRQRSEEELVSCFCCFRLFLLSDHLSAPSADFNHISDDEENGEKTPLIRYRGPQSV